MTIPRISHQTAATPRLRKRHRGYRQRLLDLHPSWRHHFYDDDACRGLLAAELPDLLSLYDAYPTHIQRVDLFRVVAVYLRGGFYLDIDMVCCQPLDALCDERCVVAEEKMLSPRELRRLGHRHPSRVANYMFGSEPRHPFWLEIMTEMLERSQRPIRSEVDVLQSTGPGLVTAVYHRVEDRRPEVTLLRNRRTRCHCGHVSCQFGTFASHRHEGTWRWQRAWWKRSPAASDGGADARPTVDRRRVRELLDRERGLAAGAAT